MTTHMDPTLQAALTADSPLVFFAVEILFKTYAVRLVDGSGQVTIGVNTFTGLDPVYGTLVGPDVFQDGVAAEAPHLTFQIQPPTNTAAATLSAPGGQGAQVSLWFGAINRATGLAIGTPYLIFLGQVSTMALIADRGMRVVKFDIESAWDRFFDVDEGLLLTNAAHQAFWPGELGLEYVTNVQAQIPWGSDLPRPVVVHDVPFGSPAYSNGSGSAYIGGSTFSGFGGFGGLAGINLGGGF